MPLYRYSTVTSSGMIAADSLTDAKQKLRSAHVLITSLAAIEEMTKQRASFSSSAFLLCFTREMAQLLKAGLPLYESLVTIEEKYQKHKSHSLLLSLCDQLKCGKSLSSALANHSNTFGPIYLSMVRAAEQTGNLDKTFGQLALLLAKQQKLKKTLISALSYPLLLLSFCVVVSSVLLLYVVPSLKELFEERALHPMTEVVLALSNFLNNHYVLLLVSFAAVVGFLVFAYRHERCRPLVERLLFQLPVVKSLLLQSSLTSFCRTLSLLLFGGVSLLEALSLANGVISYRILKAPFEEARVNIAEGGALSQALKRSAILPPLVPRMVGIAEETGKLPEMLESISEIYEEEMEKNIAQLTAILQPALIITLGLIVGVILLSVLIPLTDVSSILN